MNLFIVGLNHRTAPIEIRETVAVPGDRIQEALVSLRDEFGFEEAMIVSTCNRVEVYARGVGEDSSLRVKDFLCSRNSLSRETLDEYLYTYTGDDLVRHLFRVTSSLDSMVQGEPQILGQMKQAFAQSGRANVVGETLSRLMQRSFFVAKRVRTETRIANSAVSVSSVAVELAKKIFGELSGKTILLLGAGKMGELAVQNLLASGGSTILVANRTSGRSEKVVERLGGTSVDFGALETHLVNSDIVVVSTGSASHILDRQLMERVIKKRLYSPLFVIDIAVPRNVAPAVNEIDNIFLFDIDDLESVVTSNREGRSREAELAEAIIDQEVRSFLAYQDSQHLGPFIQSFRDKIEEICLEELESSRNGLELSELERTEKLVRRIARRIAHPLTVQIKRPVRDPGSREYNIELIRKAFELDDQE